MCSPVALSGSSLLHPVNELSGSSSPVETLPSVCWVAVLGHLCQKPVALIFTAEDGCPVHSSGEKPLLFTGIFFLLYLCFFSLLFFFLKTLYASILVCLRGFFLFGNRFASVCTEAVSGVMDRAGSHPRSISVPN